MLSKAIDMIEPIVDLGEAQDCLTTLFDQPDLSCAVLTGAGISTDSGIPDFRSPGGIWSKRQPVQFQDFVQSADSRREDWQRRFEMLDIFEKAEPNAAHQFLVDLENAGKLELLITQNVDGLHQRAGTSTEKLVELHGNSTYATCLDCSQRHELEPLRPVVSAGESPRCSACNGLLKAAVVSFGQQMPMKKLQHAARVAASVDVFLVIGSSLVVYPAAELPVIAAEAGATLLIVNGEETPIDARADHILRTRIAKTFEKITI